MQALTSADARKWCAAQGISLTDTGFPRASRVRRFKIPPDAGARVALVAADMRVVGARAKSLVWFDDWAVWPSGQRMHVFERFRASYGETRPLIEIPAFLFDGREFEDLVSFVTLGVLFLWDVHVIASKGRHLVFYSHDEVGWKMA
jgi:hypothetical protein